VDKTRALTLNGFSRTEASSFAASVECYSEYSLDQAVRALARDKDIVLLMSTDFEVVPGYGIRTIVDAHCIVLGNRRMIPAAESLPLTVNLEA
jgi:cation transport ATPase